MNKTIRLYQQDVDMRSHDAAVVALLQTPDEILTLGVKDKTVQCLLVLDQSVFFPEGGGQPSDQGTIDGYPICHVREIDNVVYHQIDLAAAAASGLEAPSSYFTAGRTVHCEIDWNRRFDNMQRHCGEHILSGMFFREYGGVNRGFHMGDDYMTIDISLEEKPEFTELTMDMCLHVEHCANEAVWANLPVITRRFDHREDAEKLPLRKKLAIEHDISIVCVGDLNNPADSVACCGTHPKFAGQVGLIKIWKVEANKGMFRVYCEAGHRALKDYDTKHEILTKLNNKYSANTHDLLEKMKIAEDKMNAIRTELYNLKQSVIRQRSEMVKADLDLLASSGSGAAPEGLKAQYLNGILLYEFNDMKVDDLLTIGRPILDDIKKLVLILDSQTNTVLLFSNGTVDCGKIVKENASIYNGKGGGNKNNARALFTKRDYALTFIDLIEKHLR
ncbi:MAG: alanyl-tRNA editing protein [Firmicutes bacterium]|nr:alanyl-tRNA editing protein [Bacillota bacterium]